MTKGKKWTLRLLGVAALALLICLCLLGSTMARYTSSGVGKGTLTVALWDLEVVNSLSGDEAVEISTDPISPSMDKYKTDAARTNTSKWIEAFSVVNNSAVDASVEISMVDEDGSDTTTVGLTWADNFTWGKGWTKCESSGGEGDDVDGEGNPVSGRAQTNAYASELMEKFGFTSEKGTDAEKDADYKDQFINLVNTWGVITLELSDSDQTAVGGGSTSFTGDKAIKLLGTETEGYEQGTNDTATIYAEVVWTSICEADNKASMPGTFTDWEEFSDAVDTILGMYVTTITFDVEWTAVQASQIPSAT